MIGTGRVCETSAIRAPRVITIPTPSVSAAVAIDSEKVRQRRLGSVPSSSTRSRSALGICAARRMFSGHSMWRVWPSVRLIVGRFDWKSKNSSGSTWATTSASSELGDRLESGRGGGGGVVPAAEGADEDRRAEVWQIAFPAQ